MLACGIAALASASLSSLPTHGPIDVVDAERGRRRRAHLGTDVDGAEPLLQSVEIPGEGRGRRQAAAQSRERLVADIGAERHRLRLDPDSRQNRLRADIVAKRSRGIGREFGLLEDIQHPRALGAAEIGADDDAVGIGDDVGALAAAVDMQGPAHVAARRLRQDEGLPLDFHMRDLGLVLQMRARDGGCR